jgi:HD superfamily phosphohydrolase
MGVLCLCYKFNTSLSSKIAAILHDVAHTAFSHVYDYLIKNYREDFHDKKLDDFLIKDKEIISILDKYNFDYTQFLDMDNTFKLIKKNNDFLNFDRLDYTLREQFNFKNNLIELQEILNNIEIVKEDLVFKNKSVAQNLLNIFNYLSENHWGGKVHQTEYLIFTRILQRALDLKLITLDDFYKTDSYILDIINKSNDETILKNIDYLNNKNFDLEEVSTKLRKLNLYYRENNILNFL